MTKETHRIVVALESGAVLETRESFTDEYDENDLFEDVFKDRSTTWKDVGGIRFRFRDLAAIQIEEL